MFFVFSDIFQAVCVLFRDFLECGVVLSLGTRITLRALNSHRGAIGFAALDFSRTRRLRKNLVERRALSENRTYLIRLYIITLCKAQIG